MKSSRPQRDPNSRVCSASWATRPRRTECGYFTYGSTVTIPNWASTGYPPWSTSDCYNRISLWINHHTLVRINRNDWLGITTFIHTFCFAYLDSITIYVRTPTSASVHRVTLRDINKNRSSDEWLVDPRQRRRTSASLEKRAKKNQRQNPS